MSMFEQAKKPEPEAMVITICGHAGSGKSSLAATFPNPFLIRTTGEATPRDIPRDQMPDELEEITSADALWSLLKGLIHEPHNYKTVIFDSVTGLENLFVAHVLEADPKAKTLQSAMGGYGAGRDAVSALHHRVRKAAELLRKRRGINVVFVAHADTVNIEPPDGDGYTQYSLRLHNKSMSPYVDSVDVVGFLKQQTYARGEEGKKKAVTDGTRVLVTYLTPSSISKNRYGIEEDLIFERGKNPLQPYMGKFAPASKQQNETEKDTDQ